MCNLKIRLVVEGLRKHLEYSGTLTQSSKRIVGCVYSSPSYYFSDLGDECLARLRKEILNPLMFVSCD